MKSKFIMLVIVILPMLMLAQHRWETIIGNSDIDYYLYNKKIAYDDGYLVNLAETNIDIQMMLKTDNNGVELWQKVINNSGSSVQLNALAQNNQQIVVAGSTQGFPCLVSLNQCGEKNWCSKFINSEYRSGFICDVIILNNNNIIALTYLEHTDPSNKTERIFLLCYNPNGNLIWKKSFATFENNPLMEFPLPYYLTKFKNYYIISGYCYYPFPSNPSLMGMRPLFIRIDSFFNEQWVLPYGVNDSFIGFGLGVIEDKNKLENIAVGGYHIPFSNTYNTAIMHFDSLGDETGFNLISNVSIDSTIVTNSSIDIVETSNNNYILNSEFGPESYGNPFGEILIDSTYSVIDYLSHENTTSNIARITPLPDSSYLFATNFYVNPPSNYNRNILLYNLNADLSPAQIDTNPHNYDSLCDNLPIVSDTIYLDDCDIVTEVAEIPMPDEYYSSINAIPLHIFPNPTTGSITFEFENIEHHDDIIISCYDIVGQKVFEQQLIPEQSIINSNVVSWNSGIYIAIVRSSKGGNSIEKFIVK